MTHKTRPPSVKPRTTLALRGSTSTPKLQLDHASHLAAEWARQWLKVGPGGMAVDPLTSGTVRRALAVYVDHLQRPDLDPVQEARAVRSVCCASKPDPEDREVAWKRLEGHQQGDPFPSFCEVLHGPQQASKWAAFDDRVEELVQQINRERSQHMNNRKRNPNP